MAKVVTDSGVYKGYFVTGTDSTIQISPGERYIGNAIQHIPVTSIRELEVKKPAGNNILGVATATVLGFILTAGLANNGGDINDDGETSFFELVFSAIEGTTSKNRRRRNTALIVGAAGGTLFLVAGILSSKKFSLVFPLNDRQKFYRSKRYELLHYTGF